MNLIGQKAKNAVVNKIDSKTKNKGYIKEGYDADLTIVDMKKEQIIKDEWVSFIDANIIFNDISNEETLKKLNNILNTSQDKKLMIIYLSPCKFIRILELFMYLNAIYDFILLFLVPI